MRRRRRGADPGTTAAPVPATREVDDLPGFYDNPPGSPPAASSNAGPAPDPTPEPAVDARPRRRRWAVAAAGAVVVVGVVTAVALTTGQDREPTPPARTSTTTDRPSSPSAPASATPLTAEAAGDLADLDLSPGNDGFTAALTASGVVLEPRAVGVTVAYPQLTVSTDGKQSVAHLDLTVWNCLADAPPADPAAADCRRSLAEYADLGSPDLALTRTDDGLRLSGTFATYTRPNGSPAAYTGRSYLLEVQVRETADGPSGTLRLGTGEATVVPPGEVDG